MLLLWMACTSADPSDPAPAPAAEDPPGAASDPVWDPTVLAEYRATLPADWEAQLAALIPADGCADRGTILGSLDYVDPVTGGTEHYDDVSFRYRGHSALREGQRFGFKVAFDDVDPDARFHGLKHLNLLGTEGDFTLMRERVAMGFLEDQGNVAPRVNHALLTINGELQGVFPNSEEPDDQPFLDHHFTDPDGHLYKVEGYCGGQADFQYVGDDPAAYGRYDPRAGTEAEDALADLIPFLQCASQADDAALDACIDDWIDTDQWITEMAVDAVLPDVDGLAGAGQNFLLYFDPGQQRFVVYPWDKDQSFATTSLVDDSIFAFHPPWANAPTLTQRLRRLRKDQYCATVLSLLDDYTDLSGTFADLADLLETDIARDPFLADAGWADLVSGLQQDVASREPLVRGQAEACAP